MAVIKFRKPGSNLPDAQDNDYEGLYSAGSKDGGGEEERKAAPQRRRSAARSVLRTLLAAGAVVLLIALIFIQSKVRVFTSATYSKIADLTGDSNAQYMALGSSIVSYSRDGASCMDVHGKKIWSVSYEFQKPLTAAAGSILAIADYNGNEIYILGADGEIGKVDTGKPIRMIAASESGEVAAVLEDSDVTWIYLYSQKGETIAYFKTTMAQSGYPLAVAISPNGEVAGVSHLTIGTQTPQTSIAFYNFGAVGANSVENNVSGFNYDNEVFPYLRYVGENTMAAVSDRRIAFFTGKEIPESGANAMFNAEVQGVFAGGSYTGVLFANSAGGSADDAVDNKAAGASSPNASGQSSAYRLRIYNNSGNVISEIPFSLEYSDILISGERVIVYNAQRLQIYSLSGNLRYDGEFRTDVKAVIPDADSATKLVLIEEKKAELMTLE